MPQRALPTLGRAVGRAPASTEGAVAPVPVPGSVPVELGGSCGVDTAGLLKSVTADPTAAAVTISQKYQSTLVFRPGS